MSIRPPSGGGSGTSGAVLVYVDAGDDLSTARPSEATGPVYWLFDNGTVTGDAGENIVNALPGDLWFVAGA